MSRPWEKLSRSIITDDGELKSVNDDTFDNHYMPKIIMTLYHYMFQMIAEERAPMIKQPEVGATYDAFLNKPEVGSFLTPHHRHVLASTGHHS